MKPVFQYLLEAHLPSDLRARLRKHIRRIAEQGNCIAVSFSENTPKVADQNLMAPKGRIVVVVPLDDFGQTYEKNGATYVIDNAQGPTKFESKFEVIVPTKKRNERSCYIESPWKRSLIWEPGQEERFFTVLLEFVTALQAAYDAYITRCSDPLTLVINPGSAPPEFIAELLAEMSLLYRAMNGAGIDFSNEGLVVAKEEVVEL